MLRVLSCLVAVLCLSSCSDLGDPLKPQPQSSLTATSLDFGTVAVSRSTTRTLIISNSGTGSLVGTAELSCPEYSFLSGGGAFTLRSGESRTIEVSFAPGGVGTFPCTLALGPNAPPVALVGAAALQAPGARCVVLPNSIPFGSIVTGNPVVATFEVLSAGTAPLLVNIVSPCADFQILAGGGPAEIPIGGSVSVSVAYNPTASGLSSCELEIGPGCPNVAATGFGISVSFTNDIKPLLNARCGACHYFADATDPSMYAYLVTDGAPFTFWTIKPNDLGHSTIYSRVIPNSIGARMPQGGPYLSDTDIDKIRRWIQEGALEN